MGTGNFGVPSLRALYETGHEIAGLVTQPAALDRRGRPLPDPEIVRLAEAHGTPLFRFAKIKSSEAVAQLRELCADVFFICDYGQILSHEGIVSARLGGVNLHGSLLPRYRGAAPVQWAMYHGDREAGVTVLHVTPEVDAGPMMDSASLTVPEDWTAVELERALAELGAPLVVRAMARLESGVDTFQAVPQDAAQVCGAPKLRKSHARVDWSRSAVEIRNQVRAFEPWPRAFTVWKRAGSDRELRLILLPIPDAVGDSAPDGAAPGTVLHVGETLDIATGRGVLRVHRLQPEGKNAMDVPAFLRGYPMRPGDVCLS